MSVIQRVRQFAENNNLLGNAKVQPVDLVLRLGENGCFLGYDPLAKGSTMTLMPTPNRTSGVAAFVPREKLEYILGHGGKRPVEAHANFVARVSDIFNQVHDKANEIKPLWDFLNSTSEIQKAVAAIGELGNNFDSKNAWVVIRIDNDYVFDMQCVKEFYFKTGNKIKCAVTGLDDEQIILADKEKTWAKSQMVSHNDPSRRPMGLDDPEKFFLGKNTSQAMSRTLAFLKRKKCYQYLDDTHILFFWSSAGDKTDASADVFAELLDIDESSVADEDKFEANDHLAKQIAAPFTGSEFALQDKIVHILIMKVLDYTCTVAAYHELPYEEVTASLKEWSDFAKWSDKHYNLKSYRDTEFSNSKNYNIELYKAILFGKEFPALFVKMLAERIKFNTLSTKFICAYGHNGQLAFANYIRRNQMNESMYNLGKFVAICVQQQFFGNGSDNLMARCQQTIFKNPRQGIAMLCKATSPWDGVGHLDARKTEALAAIKDIPNRIDDKNALDFWKGFHEEKSALIAAIKARKLQKIE